MTAPASPSRRSRRFTRGCSAAVRAAASGGYSRAISASSRVAPHCGLDFEFAQSGDGPAVFIILIAGFIVTGAALLVEVAYRPPMWLHALLWLPLGLGLPLLMLRPFKATLVALQYKYRAGEGRMDDGD